MIGTGRNGIRSEIKPSVLSPLLGSRTETLFFSDIWEQRSDSWQLTINPRWLLGAADLPDLLSLPRPTGGCPVTLGRMHEERYQHLTLRHRKDSCSTAELFDGWRHGFTLIIPELHRFWPIASLFADTLKRQIGLAAELNLYYTPPNSIAFPAHYDTHDVLIVQIFGLKLWKLFQSIVQLPFPDELFKDSPIASDVFETPTSSISLAAGNVLYLPRGVVHAARTGELPSLHLSIGLYPKLWRDMLAPSSRLDALRMHLRRGVSPFYYTDPCPSNAPSELRPFLAATQKGH